MPEFDTDELLKCIVALVRTDLEWVPVEGVRQKWIFPYVSTERLQLEAFADAITTGSDYPISTDDVVNGVAAFEAVSTSLPSGARIDL